MLDCRIMVIRQNQRSLVHVLHLLIGTNFRVKKRGIMSPICVTKNPFFFFFSLVLCGFWLSVAFAEWDMQIVPFCEGGLLFTWPFSS